jgi:hypothetical protein
MVVRKLNSGLFLVDNSQTSIDNPEMMSMRDATTFMQRPGAMEAIRLASKADGELQGAETVFERINRSASREYDRDDKRIKSLQSVNRGVL